MTTSSENIKVLSSNTDDENLDKENTLSSSHKRQTRPGLEINTSKTNAFFNTDNSSTPRPPPSISRKISIRQNTNEPKVPFTSLASTIPPATPISNELNSDDDLYHHDSYASRLRSLIASRLNPPTPSPSTVSPIIYDGIDELQSLPTPLPPSIIHTFPTANSAIQQIPVLSTHFHKIKSSTPLILSELPSLGQDYLPYSIPPSKIREEDHPDLIGKQIGSFRVCKLLGVGAFSRVYLSQHIDTCEFFALKSIHKLKLVDEPRVKSSVEREVGILKCIDHPNIVHLEAVMETEKMMCIVLEYVEGGELFDRVGLMHQNPNATVNEGQIRFLFLQLLGAVQWLHNHNVVHRDLKLENILIHKNEDNLDELKITDFGLARVIDPNNPLLSTRCGSEEYAAPEILQQQPYDGRKTDVWSLGIILYALLVGYLPFRYDPRKERVSQLFYRIVRADIKWPKESSITSEARNVVQAILERNPEKRIEICEIKQLPWFQISN